MWIHSLKSLTDALSLPETAASKSKLKTECSSPSLFCLVYTPSDRETEQQQCYYPTTANTYHPWSTCPGSDTTSCVCVWVTQLCPTLRDPWTGAHQAPPSLGHPRQEHWSGLLFPSPGIKPWFLALQADCLPPESPGKPASTYNPYVNFSSQHTDEVASCLQMKKQLSSWKVYKLPSVV